MSVAVRRRRSRPRNRLGNRLSARRCQLIWSHVPLTQARLRTRNPEEGDDELESQAVILQIMRAAGGEMSQEECQRWYEFLYFIKNIIEGFGHDFATFDATEIEDALEEAFNLRPAANDGDENDGENANPNNNGG